MPKSNKAKIGGLQNPKNYNFYQSEKVNFDALGPYEFIKVDHKT